MKNLHWSSHAGGSGDRLESHVRGAVALFLVFGASSLAHAYAHLTFSPLIPTTWGAPARPAFGIGAVAGQLSDANGATAQDEIYTLTIQTSGASPDTRSVYGTAYFDSYYDPRGNLAAGTYSYVVVAGGISHESYNNGWTEGHWEEEHNNPEDPEEVTGWHWVDGRYDTGFNSFYDQNLEQIQFVLMPAASQSISFSNPGTRLVGDTFSLGATASSSLPISYNLQAGVGSIAGSTFTATTAGTATIRANQSGGAVGGNFYMPASPVDQSFAVNGHSQTISFPPLGIRTHLEPPIALSATASSSLPVTFAVDSGPGTLSGSTLTFTGAGTVVVTANQAGNGSYQPASTSQSVVVAKASQSINFPVIPTQILTDSPFNPGATATSTMGVSYNVLSGPASATSYQVMLTGVGEVTLQAFQSGNANFNAAPPSVTRAFSVTNVVSVTQTNVGVPGAVPAFNVDFAPGATVTYASMTVVDATTGTTIGTFYPLTSSVWGASYNATINYTSNTSTWVDPRGLAFNGVHEYRFSITACGPTLGWRTYGPTSKTVAIVGGPIGAMNVVPGAGGAANFTVVFENHGYGSGVTNLAVTDRSTGQTWDHALSSVTQSHAMTWSDPRTPTPNGYRTFAFTATGLVLGVPYSLSAEATYLESILSLVPVAPLEMQNQGQPQFQVAVANTPMGLNYLRVGAAGQLWYLSSGSGVTTHPVSNNGANGISLQFNDPRGTLGIGNHTFTVDALGSEYVNQRYWVEGHEEEEHNNPEDPSEVTGTHWVDGDWHDNWFLDDWALLDQETLTFRIAVPEATAPPDTTAPTAPGVPQVTAITATSFLLTWSAATDSGGVAGYRLWINGNFVGTTSATSWLAAGLLPNTAQLVEVRAFDRSNNQSAPSSTTATTLAGSGVVGVSATTLGANTVILSWHASSSGLAAAAYRVYRTPSGGGTTLDRGTTRDPVFVDTGLSGGSNYIYTVKRVNHLGVEQTDTFATLSVATSSNSAGDEDGDGVPTPIEQVLGTNANISATLDSANSLKAKVHRPNL